MTNLSPKSQSILSTFMSVYPVSGYVAFEGERLGISAVLRKIVGDYETWEDGTYMVKSEDILKIVEELEQF